MTEFLEGLIPWTDDEKFVYCWEAINTARFCPLVSVAHTLKINTEWDENRKFHLRIVNL